MFNDYFSLTRAVIIDMKNMTRRFLKPNGVQIFRDLGYTRYEIIGDQLRAWNDKRNDFLIEKLPYQVGEIVAVAQKYKDIYDLYIRTKDYRYNIAIKNPTDTAGWNNKMFVRADVMPERIKFTGLKIENLQDISNEDCLKEGIYECKGCLKGMYTYDNAPTYYETPRKAFASLINRVSGKGTWESNPFVLAYSFERIKNEKK